MIGWAARDGHATAAMAAARAAGEMASNRSQGGGGSHEGGAGSGGEMRAAKEQWERTGSLRQNRGRTKKGGEEGGRPTVLRGMGLGATPNKRMHRSAAGGFLMIGRVRHAAPGDA